MDAAREFFGQAKIALEAGRLIAFPETAFAAAELLAKSELLTLPDRAFRDSRRHGTIRARYNEWAHSGNTEQRFADLLNQLDAQRTPSRYLRGADGLSATKAEEWMAILRDMLDHVVEVSPDRSLDRRPRDRSLSLRAAEDIEAGTPVAFQCSS